MKTTFRLPVEVPDTKGTVLKELHLMDVLERLD